MAGQWLANGWPMVGEWLANGWPIVGQWLAIGWSMVEQWLANGWPMVGQWLANGWPMAGHWLANGWPTVVQYGSRVTFEQNLDTMFIHVAGTSLFRRVVGGSRPDFALLVGCSSLFLVCM